MDRKSVQWRGYIPAVTTPFTRDGALDLDAMERLLQWLLEEGMHGIIIGGTQGEWFTITAPERKQLMQIVGRKLSGKMPLIAGCSAYTSADVAANAKLAAEHGFDGILVTPPPYMVPTNREILGFYREVNAAVTLPICAYNWPPGTGIDMSLELLRSIAELSNVVAIKNSTADLRHFIDVFFALKDQVRVFGVPPQPSMIRPPENASTVAVADSCACAHNGSSSATARCQARRFITVHLMSAESSASVVALRGGAAADQC